MALSVHIKKKLKDFELAVDFDMNEKIREKGLKKSDIYIAADISEGYGSKLITQEKTTRQRDVILRLCYAAKLTLSETQHALQLYHMERLYARNKRDALIMVCFNERNNIKLFRRE